MRKIAPLLCMLMLGSGLFSQPAQNPALSDSVQTEPGDTLKTKPRRDYRVKDEEDDWLKTWEKIQPSIKEFLSEDEDTEIEWYEDESGRRKKRKSGFFRGGAGGWDYYLFPEMNLSSLNTELTAIGLDALPTSLEMMGGGGWVFMGKNIRIGGFGAGGSLSSNDKNAQDIAQDINFRLNLSGFLIEKVFHPFSKTEIYLGTTLGSGKASLKITQQKGKPDWDEIWQGLNTTDTDEYYQLKMKSRFFTAMPALGFRYNILRWIGIGANVGYLYGEAKDWSTSGDNVNAAPEMDLSNVFYRFNLYFGG